MARGLILICFYALLAGCSSPKKPLNYILNGQAESKGNVVPITLYGKGSLGFLHLEISFRNTSADIDCAGRPDSDFQEENELQFRLWHPETRKPIDHNLDTWHAVVYCKNGESGKIVLTRKDEQWVGNGNVGDRKIQLRLIYDERQFLSQ